MRVMQLPSVALGLLRQQTLASRRRTGDEVQHNSPCPTNNRRNIVNKSSECNVKTISIAPLQGIYPEALPVLASYVMLNVIRNDYVPSVSKTMLSYEPRELPVVGPCTLVEPTRVNANL